MRPRTILALLLIPPAPAATLTGKVIAAHTGSPLASVNVQVHKVGQRTLAADLETDLHGRFEATGLLEGDYRIEISKPNHLVSTLSVHLPSDGVNVSVRLVRLGVITGRVTDHQGQPLSGAAVFAMPKAADGRPLRTKLELGSYAHVNPSGQYRLHSLPPGEYAVAVSYGASTFAVGSSGSAATNAKYGSGYLFYPDNIQPRFLVVAGGEEHRNIDLAVIPAALYTVSGKVELPEPKQRFLVGLATLEQPGFATAVVNSSEDGTFKLAGVPPGSYHLFAAGPTNARNSAGFILNDGTFYARSRIDVTGEDIANLSIAPQPGPTVNFLLRTSGTGCPSTAALVIAQLEDWGSSRRITNVSISTEKPTAVATLVPTRYAVSVKIAGDTCYSTSDTMLDLTSGSPPDPVILSIAPGGSIRGRLDPAGRPIASFAVMVMPSDPTQTPQPSRLAVPDADSRFSLDGLRPGKYRIAALPAASASQADMSRMFEIEVFGGSTLDVDLAAPPVHKQP